MSSSPKRARRVPHTGTEALEQGLPERSPDTSSSHALPYKTHPFSLSTLPDAALQQICVLASTPACPAPCLLSRASKEWAAAVAKHVRDARVQLIMGQARTSSMVAAGAALAAPPRTNILQLQPAPDAPQINQPADGLTARIQATTARLFSLSLWLKKSSTQIGALTLTSNSKYASSSLDFWQRSLLLPGMASVMQAMAAGRAAQGGMRLTAMDLEVLSHSQLQATLDTLSACKRLRRLRLTGAVEEQGPAASAARNWTLCGHVASSSSAAATSATSSSMFRLGVSLSGMSALTHLQLSMDLLREGQQTGAGSRRKGRLDVHPLLLKLPNQLQELHLTASQGLTMSLASIKHLTGLRRLQLPCRLELAPPPTGVTTAALVSGLTQLSSLTCGAALLPRTLALLDCPGLEQVSNERCCCGRDSSCWLFDASSAGMEKLGMVKGLRALRLRATSPVPLPQQLQHLTLLKASDNDAGNKAWMQGLHNLQNLRSLDLLARMLLTKMDVVTEDAPHPLRALTALTRLAVNCRGASPKLEVAAPAAADPGPGAAAAEDAAAAAAAQEGAGGEPAAQEEAPGVQGPPAEAPAVTQQEHPLGAVGRVLDLVQREAGGLERLELSWVDRPVAEVLAAAATQLPGMVVAASQQELGTQELEA